MGERGAVRPVIWFTLHPGGGHHLDQLLQVELKPPLAGIGQQAAAFTMCRIRLAVDVLPVGRDVQLVAGIERGLEELS